MEKSMELRVVGEGFVGDEGSRAMVFLYGEVGGLGKITNREEWVVLEDVTSLDAPALFHCVPKCIQGVPLIVGREIFLVEHLSEFYSEILSFSLRSFCPIGQEVLSWKVCAKKKKKKILVSVVN